MNLSKQNFYSLVAAIFVILYYKEVCRNGPSDNEALIRWKSRQNKRTETSLEKSEETLHEALIQRTDKNLRKSKQLMNTGKIRSKSESAVTMNSNLTKESIPATGPTFTLGATGRNPGSETWQEGYERITDSNECFLYAEKETGVSKGSVVNDESELYGCSVQNNKVNYNTHAVGCGYGKSCRGGARLVCERKTYNTKFDEIKSCGSAKAIDGGGKPVTTSCTVSGVSKSEQKARQDLMKRYYECRVREYDQLKEYEKAMGSIGRTSWSLRGPPVCGMLPEARYLNQRDGNDECPSESVIKGAIVFCWRVVQDTLPQNMKTKGRPDTRAHKAQSAQDTFVWNRYFNSPRKPSRGYAKLNVQIAEIVAIEVKGKQETVRVHLYSPDSDKGINDKHAHKRPWYPLMKVGPNGYQMQKEKPKNLTRGVMQARLIKELKVEDILPIPPLKMESGNVISVDDQRRIREAVNNGEAQDLRITGKKRKYVDRDPRQYWYVRYTSVKTFAKTGVNIDGKAESVKRVPEHIHRLALREARTHDPMRWIKQIQSWQLDEWRTRRTARRPKGTSTMSGQREDSIRA